MNSAPLKSVALLTAFVSALTLLGGCASSRSGSAYNRDQALGEMTVRVGTVDSVRAVRIEGTKSPVGGLAGGAVGGLAGSTLGHGRGSTVGAILGAVAGGVAGSAVEEGVTRRDGVEITVKLDNGQLVAVTQEAEETFQIGQRVRILSGRGATRVAAY